MTNPLSTKGAMQYGSMSQRGNQRTRALKLAAAGLMGIALLYAAHSLLRASPDMGPLQRIGEPLVYGLMIDAGSTGSRIHTFSFRKDNMQLVREDFLGLKPGLSSYVNDPAAAARSLEPLLQRARSIVPIAERESTPVFVRATAGLRAVGVIRAEKILDEVRTYLAQSGFRFDAIPWASVMDGSDEGVFSWITVNYLMGRTAGSTVGTLEMGGGSAQIAFVPSEAPPLANECAPKLLTSHLGDATVGLYSKSDLGFGLQKARSIALTAFERDNIIANNYCANKGAHVDVKVPFDDSGRAVSMGGSGDFAKCRVLVKKAVIDLRKNATCACSACGYDSVARPKPIHEYVGLAFYRERTIPLGMPARLTVTDIRKKGEEVCALSVDEVRTRYPHIPNGQATDLCLDLAYIVEHLDSGHGINEESGTVLQMSDKINNIQLGWSLGAMFSEMTKLRGKVWG